MEQAYIYIYIFLAMEQAATYTNKTALSVDVGATLIDSNSGKIIYH